MGEKTGVLMLMIATLVVSSIFLVINKGSTAEIAEDIRGKMLGIVNTVKGDKEDEDVEGGKGGVNTGSLVLKVPYEVIRYFNDVNDISELLELFKEDCANYGSEYCFDVLEFDEETGKYKSLGEEAINEIKMDTSQVNMNKRGMYPVFFTYEDKETGDIYRVATYYDVYVYDNSENGKLGFRESDFYSLDNYGGKHRLTTWRGKEILLEGEMPTLQELRDNGLLRMYFRDKDTGEYKDLDGTEEGIEIEVPPFDKNVPGIYIYTVTYTDSDTGNIYEGYIEFSYFFDREEGIHSSDAVTRK